MTPRKVLLVGWDAADWKVIRPLMAAGKMPNVQRLVTNGAAGSIATLHPPLSPMLWTSIATGKRPFKHGIHGFTEPAPDGSGVRPITNLSRKAKALWNILSQNELRSVVIGWWPSHPAEPIRGVMVSDRYHRARGPLSDGWPMPANTVHPADLAGVLAAQRIHPDLIVPEMVEPFIPLAREIDQQKDTRLALLLRTLAECMSIQAAATWLLDHEPWELFVVYFESIDHFCHGFMRYHPPRQPWIGSRDFDLYHNVVSRAYQLHDEMLGTLMQKAGDDAVVILMSDHGFHPDHLRPASIPDIPAGPAVEHRDHGVFAICGPGVRQVQTVYGPSLLDITPTVLEIFGLPVGEDMDGKVLSQVFAETPKVEFIPSWEDVPGDDGRHRSHTRVDPVAAHEAMEQLIALGYVERPGGNGVVAIKAAARDLRYNLGEAYQDDGRHAEAHEIFRELYEAAPDEQRFAVRLFVSCQALGLHDQMRSIVTSDNLARFEPLVADYLKAQMLIVEQRYAEAMDALEPLIEMNQTQPALYLQAGELCERLERDRNAQHIYEKALAIDPDSAQAAIGLCRIALRQKEYPAATQLALDALQRAYHNPEAHYLLGRALAGRKEYAPAAEAFRAAISFNPNFPEAHSRLADLLADHLGDAASAREHRQFAHGMKAPVVRSQAAEAFESTAPVFTTQAAAPLTDSLIVVTGLPRSGTSLLMQMLAAGGVSVLSDEKRLADEDNPRGYLEYEPVKNLLKDSSWLRDARGKAVKIVAPLLIALPPGLPCRVILCERNLDEVLDSQERMLEHRNQTSLATPARRRTLKDEYLRTLDRVKTMLAARRDTHTLIVEYQAAVSRPLPAAERINHFLGDGRDVAKMAAAVDPALHRNRRSQI